MIMRMAAGLAIDSASAAWAWPADRCGSSAYVEAIVASTVAAVSTVGGGECPDPDDVGAGLVIGSDRAAAATGVVLSLRWAWFSVDVAVGVEMSAVTADAAAVG
jgi:hypothetical protein